MLPIWQRSVLYVKVIKHYLLQYNTVLYLNVSETACFIHMIWILKQFKIMLITSSIIKIVHITLFACSPDLVQLC